MPPCGCGCLEASSISALALFEDAGIRSHPLCSHRAGAGYMLPLLRALLEEADRQATQVINQYQKDSQFETMVITLAEMVFG